ncbi:MAG: hypothetical protein ACPG5Z_00175 [Pseudoalteromonas sp.]
MWETILSTVLSLAGWLIARKKEDKEAQKKFLELTHYLQSQGSLSAKVYVNHVVRLRNLDEKIDSKKI